MSAACRTGYVNSPTVVRSCPLGRLVLELRHPGGLAEARDAAEYPGKLGVLWDVGLHEERALSRIHAHRDELRCGGQRALSQNLRVVVDGDRMHVDDAVERVVVELQGDPVPQRPEVVAEVEGVSCRLYA